MNYYERIQKSVDFIECNLENHIVVEDMAKEAYMSISNFYRLFFAITGFQAKEYMIYRRVSQAARELKDTHAKVIDLAVKFAYDSPDAFSRIFKKITGYSPSTYAQGNESYVFERINVMEKYFETTDDEMLEKYPDIKIIHTLPDMRVAYYCYYGTEPEDGAFEVMRDWILKNKIDFKNENYRIFGYNAPDSDPSSKEYGYEVCITIPDNLKVEDNLVKTKVLQGGLFAIVSISPCNDLGDEIMKGWKRFMKWLEGSKYIYGECQWLEEHLGFGDQFEHLGGVDLYLPILPKAYLEDIEVIPEHILPFTVATFTGTGKNAEQIARNYMFEWAIKQGIDFSSEQVRVFSYYNYERIGTPDYFYKLHITIPESMIIEDSKIIKEVFEGGQYLKRTVKYKINGQSWFDFIKKIQHSQTYDFAPIPFMEEYRLTKPVINMETEVIQHMPVREI